MTEDRKARTRLKPQEQAEEDAAKDDTAQEDTGEVHTELRPAGTGPRPRAKVLPPEIGEDNGEDDLFNDMPV